MARRIVSFLPSATEMIYALGAQDMLHGVTHECDRPPEAASKPKVIRSSFDPAAMSSKEIDDATARAGEGVFVLDEKALMEARPDLIIAQDTCKVCAPHSAQAARALEIVDGARAHSMDPHDMAGILDSITDLAGVIGREGEGREIRGALEERIAAAGAAGPGPRVLALEWVDPLYTSGHWVPDMIAAAGGTDAVGAAGAHSRRMDMEEAAASDPDKVVLMPCGFDAARAESEYRGSLATNVRWRQMRAVAEGEVYAVDSAAYFTRPGIGVAAGVEIIANILRPGSADAPRGACKKMGPP
ncbi:ABC-type Fe3 -hydroxamate transport system, periplasmic component [Cenarchaeum symbiosum A]|uniref:ABC-type Fe3-hydroxamate transport system, periplasmic component n=1 Tax=Cenarchaeum symbiosum (strain A) TaxID=414004 RepID=A0RUQ4_CENSY|nr:ABC-type Fe3 -hydroxamate transport system, periplasmic component [Cenarchaeum symbiosum A]